MTVEPWQPQQPTDTWVPVLAAIGDLATKIGGTTFIPRAIRGNPAAVAATILTGRELDLGPMISLRVIQIIDGTPSLTAEGLAGRILAAGHSIEWVESTNTRATVRITRGDGRSTATATWTMKDAEDANLLSKQAWRQYPRYMLRHRAVTEAAGMACPDVKLGLDVAPEPSGDPQPTSGTHVIQLAANEAKQPTLNAGTVQEPPAGITPEPGTQEEDAAPPRQPATINQLRKLNAQLNHLAKLRGQRPDREDQLQQVATLLDLDHLDSSRDLDTDQAATAIDRLGILIQEHQDAAEDQG